MENPTGKLSLKFRQKKGGGTYLAEQYFKLPLQIMSPHYQDEDGTAFVYLLNPSGGILQHDRLLTEITVEENAKVLVTTPSSTKFYKMDDGYAVLENNITVKGGGILEYLPEHNVPFAESKTYQVNNFYLEEDVTLIASDMVTAGRVSRGERFQYGLYSSKTKIYVGGKLIAFDNGHIEPSNMNLSGIGMLEGSGSNGTIYIYKKDLSNTLIHKINSIELWGKKISFGVTAVNDSLTIVRFMGESMIDMQEAMLKVWEVIRQTLLHKPSVRIRKY